MPSMLLQIVNNVGLISDLRESRYHCIAVKPFTDQSPEHDPR